MATTTTTQVSHAVNNFYNKKLLERAVPALVHDMFGQLKDIPANNTNVIKFRRYGALSAATTALTEGTTPSSTQLSVTDISATVSQYGAWVEVTDWLSMTTLDPVWTEMAALLGEQAGDSVDQIVRDPLHTGTSVRYAGGQTARGNVTSSDIPAAADIKKIVRTLKGNNARKLTQRVAPDRGYGTSPVDATFIGIVHPNTTYDLKGLTGFIPVQDYASKADLMPHEIGALDEVRFVESTNAKVFSSAGASSIDVYSTIIMGANAYGVTRIGGNALVNIRKELGSAGTSDPLNQLGSSGWKATVVSKILNDDFIVRYEHAVSS